MAGRHVEGFSSRDTVGRWHGLPGGQKMVKKKMEKLLFGILSMGIPMDGACAAVVLCTLVAFREADAPVH